MEKIKTRFIDCLYPDWEGGFTREKHTLECFDKDGFCKTCGMTTEQASCGEIKQINYGKNNS